MIETGMSAEREILVLHADAEELQLVCARVGRQAVEICDASSFWAGAKEQESSALHDENALDALDAHISQRGWTGRDLICMISGSTVACYHYDMPPLKGAALRQAVLLKLGQQLHFNVDEAIVAIDPVKQTDRVTHAQRHVNVAAVHSATAAAAVRAAARVGLNLVALSAAPAALSALAGEVFENEPGLSALLHVDEQLSTLVILADQAPCVTAELPIGMADLATALMRPIINGDEVIHLDRAEAAALRDEVGIPTPDQEIESIGVNGSRLLPLIEPVLQKFAKQLTQWLTFASTTADNAPVRLLRIVGPGTAVSGFAETMASRLSLEVRAEDWLTNLATVSGAAGSLPVESFAVAVGAIRARRALPDLIPPDVRRQRRLRRIRRSITFCGPCVAAAIVGLALLFQNVDTNLDSFAGTSQKQLAKVEQIIGTNTQLAAKYRSVSQLQREFDEFARTTPNWVGLFKEFSYLLPDELQARQFVARSTEDGITLTVSAVVYTNENGRSFDEAVERTLLLLQRSAFFEHVELLTANRGRQDDTISAAGSLVVELALAHPRPGQRV